MVIVANLAVIAILSVLAYTLLAIGPLFSLGALIGFFWCYFSYGCWRTDREWERTAHFTDPPQS
jgi:hypothetical protein